MNKIHLPLNNLSKDVYQKKRFLNEEILFYFVTKRMCMIFAGG